ncbi:MAG TPA: phosphoglycerate kinase [Candidatus Wallbacteria bacterium]|nr:MAG: Bifunctional PGK [bacterium ADurb.Bin243]HOD41406.1 phosphoglycerate kinase [Candidatus Wallbacteria bacterium]HPG57621.1 phosphoglycerate kinase [Candidatus Wallbacteria bacterium]
MNKFTVRDIDFNGARALVRVDFNVPIKNGKITDDTRIRATLPTIKNLLESRARVILMSHLGKAKGAPDPQFSLKPAADRLGELLPGVTVKFAPDCVGEEVKKMVDSLNAGEILLLENLRFHKGEEGNDPEFAKKLAAWGDIYVNDAFGTAHRAHASTEGVTKFLSPAIAGFLMEKEIAIIGKALSNPERPFYALIGGAKVSSKIEVLENLLKIVDKLIIGGGMAFTFLKAQGVAVGKSLVEDDKLEVAKEILKKAKELKKEIVLPTDAVIAAEMKEESPEKIVDINSIPADMAGYDIGPKSIEHFMSVLKDAKTIIWNGPMGVFEVNKFAKGTFDVAKLLAGMKATTIVGGGDSVAAVEKAGVADKMTHVSTGGGASLEFMEGKILPGVAALTERSSCGSCSCSGSCH